MCNHVNYTINFIDELVKMTTYSSLSDLGLDKYSLRSLHTFAMPVKASNIIWAENIEQILIARQQSEQKNEPFLLLGEGSNVLFLTDFAGTVVFNRLRGITIEEGKQDWFIHAAAGENWHNLVCYLLEKGIKGLENLALIPGCAGSAPIQNIGAYGVEFKDVCNYVDIVNLKNGQQQRLLNAECQFSYRDSIFKHKYHKDYAITAIGLRLTKLWQPKICYGDLKSLDHSIITAQAIFDSVCKIRRSKLPDPKLLGNAGSFFKNPIVSANTAKELLKAYPDAPCYNQSNGTVKLAAGWLIEQCQLKGYAIGDAAVHEQQSLILINRGNASPDDIVALARHICSTVSYHFSINLEPEVRFIGAQGECNITEVLL